MHSRDPERTSEVRCCLLGVRAQQEKHSHGSDENVRIAALSATPKALTTREVEEASAKDPELREAHPSKRYFAVAEKGDQPNIVIYEYPSLQPYRILRGEP
ncbi:uncharacterized protein ACWYII_000615 isoform 1-T3 [Salvelinus alpinus]